MMYSSYDINDLETFPLTMDSRQLKSQTYTSVQNKVLALLMLVMTTMLIIGSLAIELDHKPELFQNIYQSSHIRILIICYLIVQTSLHLMICFNSSIIMIRVTLVLTMIMEIIIIPYLAIELGISLQTLATFYFTMSVLSLVVILHYCMNWQQYGSLMLMTILVYVAFYLLVSIWLKQLLANNLVYYIGGCCLVYLLMIVNDCQRILRIQSDNKEAYKSIQFTQLSKYYLLF